MVVKMCAICAVLCLFIAAAVSIDNSAPNTAIHDYIAAHRQLRGQSQAKYLIFRDVGCEDVVGFGNRFQGFISALTLAWLTGRVFLLDERLQDGSVCSCPRCQPLSNLIDTPPIDWSYKTYDTHNVFAAHVPDNARVERFESSLGSALLLHYREEKSEDTAIDFLLCKDLLTLSATNLIFYGSYSFVHLLAANPFVGEKLLNTFGAHPYHHFAQHFLSTPHPRIKPRIEGAWAQAAKMGCKHTIGVHIRRERFREFMDDEGQDMVFRCARWMSLEYGADDVNTCVFLASDTSETRELAVEALAPLRVFGLQDDEVASDARTALAKDNAIIEWFLLRKCDDLVVTLGSSFSASAAGAEGKKPVGVTMVHGPGYTGPACVRQITPFPFANPPRWTQPQAYRPSKHLADQFSCKNSPALEQFEQKRSAMPNHSHAAFPFRFDPAIDGISLPPQRGTMPEGLVHSWQTCLVFVVQETSLFGKMAVVLAIMVYSLAIFAIASPKLFLRKLRRCVRAQKERSLENCKAMAAAQAQLQPILQMSGHMNVNMSMTMGLLKDPLTSSPHVNSHGLVRGGLGLLSGLNGLTNGCGTSTRNSAGVLTINGNGHGNGCAKQKIPRALDEDALEIVFGMDGERADSPDSPDSPEMNGDLHSHMHSHLHSHEQIHETAPRDRHAHAQDTHGRTPHAREDFGSL